MRRLWNEINAHWLSATLFLLYWPIVFALDAFGWRKLNNRPDMVQPVITLHLLLPVIAGAMVSSWRRCRSGRITGGMVAGAAVLVIDAAALVTHQMIVYHFEDSGESIFEVPVFVIAFGLFGSLLGLIGVACSTGIAHLLERWQEPAAGLVVTLDLARQRAGDDERAAVSVPAGGPGGVIPRGSLRVAGGLALGTAVVVALAVIPAVTAGRLPAITSERAAIAFTANAILNVLIGIVLLAPVSRRGADAGKVLVVMVGFVGLLLGSALLDAGSALWTSPRGMRIAAAACLGGAAGDLAAGVLALVAALRRRGKNCDGAMPEATRCHIIPPTT